jgi:hypothetical protein
MTKTVARVRYETVQGARPWVTAYWDEVQEKWFRVQTRKQIDNLIAVDWTGDLERAEAAARFMAAMR